MAGGVVAALNVELALDPVVCEGEPMEEGDYCDATSKDHTHQELDQKGRPEIMIAAGTVVALVGIAVGIFGLRARRSGTWTLG